MRTRILLLVFSLTLLGCASSRRQMERASLYEKEGMAQQAFDLYAGLHARKATNTEAHVGMQRTAQTLFDRMQASASGCYLEGNYLMGEAARSEADTYRSRMERQGLDIKWDPVLESRRSEARRTYADHLYDEADSAFRADQFSACEELTTRVLRLEPDHRRAQHLQKLTRLEPRYRMGLRALELGLYRNAFTQMKSVADVDPGYKDAWARLEEARDKASYTVSFVPLVNQMLYLGNLTLALSPMSMEMALAASVRQAILDLKDPLIVLVDRENTAELLAEQERGMQGLYDDAYAVKAGRLMGARYVLTGRVIRFDDAIAKQIEVQLQLVDAETGRIHLAEMVRVNKQELTGRGNVRAQLIDRAALRIARHLAEFDPYQR